MTATRRTRVVFAAHAFPRHQGDLTGGFLLRLAEALEREGVDVQAVAPAAPGLPARDRLRGVAVRRYRYAPRRAETLAYTGGMHLRAASPTGALALAGLLAAGALALRRVAAGADLVHAHWWFLGGVQALAAGKRPLVTTLHGTDVRLARTRPAARAACARVLRASAAITTVSTWLRDEVAALRGPAAQLPLRLVGSGPLEPDLHRLAKELGVADRLRWESGLTQPELAARYRRAAALLVPGSHEGLGLVAVEGQLSGAPVIAAASGGLLDVVTDGHSGWTFRPGDPSALANAIQQVVDHPDQAAGRAAAGRHAAADRFSATSAARIYATLYAEALEAHARPQRKGPAG